jgi:hypothetical protein
MHDDRVMTPVSPTPAPEERKSCPSRLAPNIASTFLCCLITRFVLGVGWIETRQRYTGLDFFHDPAFEPLLLRAKFHDLVDQARWYEYRAVIVADDDIIR